MKRTLLMTLWAPAMHAADVKYVVDTYEARAHREASHAASKLDSRSDLKDLAELGGGGGGAQPEGGGGGGAAALGGKGGSGVGGGGAAASAAAGGWEEQEGVEEAAAAEERRSGDVLAPLLAGPPRPSRSLSAARAAWGAAKVVTFRDRVANILKGSHARAVPEAVAPWWLPPEEQPEEVSLSTSVGVSVGMVVSVSESKCVSESEHARLCMRVGERGRLPVPWPRLQCAPHLPYGAVTTAPMWPPRCRRSSPPPACCWGRPTWRGGTGCWPPLREGGRSGPQPTSTRCCSGRRGPGPPSECGVWVG